ncbi:MAG: hypothetical protein ACTHYM_05000 [Actinomycetaceae bacterium]
MSDNEIGPRSQFRRQWESGEARGSIGLDRAERLRELSNRGELTLPHRVVGRVGRYADETWQEEPSYFLPTATSATTFVNEVFASRARANHRHYVESSRLWLPQVTRQTHGAPARVDAGGTSVEVLDAQGATALRVDFSSRLRPDDVALFDPAGTPHRSADSGRDDVPLAGTPGSLGVTDEELDFI